MLRFWVEGSGFKGSGFRVQRFRVQGSRFRIQGSGFKARRFLDFHFKFFIVGEMTFYDFNPFSFAALKVQIIANLEPLNLEPLNP